MGITLTSISFKISSSCPLSLVSFNSYDPHFGFLTVQVPSEIVSILSKLVLWTLPRVSLLRLRAFFHGRPRDYCISHLVVSSESEGANIEHI